MTCDFNAKLVETQQCLGCMHEGMLVTSSDGIILESTAASEKILETPSLNLKGSNIRSFCRSLDVYEEMVNKATAEKRCLNKSLIVEAGGKRKLVNMSVEKITDGDEVRLVH